MALHLLHHKSWHVWNRDNIAKVKNDEAEHETELREQRRLHQEAESKRRYQLLKRKANGEPVDIDEPPTEIVTEAMLQARAEAAIKAKPKESFMKAEKMLRKNKGTFDKNDDITVPVGDTWRKKRVEEEGAPDSGLDFLSKLEHESIHGKEEEVVPEKKEEKKEPLNIIDAAKERLEAERLKQLNVSIMSTMLVDKKTLNPWYEQKAGAAFITDEKNVDARKKKKREDRRNKEDPMYQMDQLVTAKREREDSIKRAEDEALHGHLSSYRRAQHQERMRKKEEEKRREERKKMKDVPKREGKKSIEEMRRERMDREKRERERAMSLPQGGRKDTDRSSRSVSLTPVLSRNERENPYHNQYGNYADGRDRGRREGYTTERAGNVSRLREDY
ncbi:hypothetical protein PROFUN_13021 [Planoprotostelium fungivorum]|uniref:CBF1-interacting co-repressor CIR N-terminal domain-containing protein n=1 Tax=Planoprotostelium fungivorum TaxID=1890364 RepID=A0A2P6N5V8_9EUKA|nr:hypothetical protein PROFUN_13021 [Planoprotostelium fungivorum]